MIHPLKPRQDNEYESLKVNLEIYQIAGNPSYGVTSNGDVFSFNYRGTGKTKKLKTFLVGRKDCKYQAVDLGAKNKNIKVHRVVAETFLAKSHDSIEVNHIDGNKLNNSIENLEWCTRSHNMRHALSTGLRKTPCGVAHGMSKLSESDVLEIRRSLDGERYWGQMTALSNKYGVSRGAIEYAYKDGWRHI